MRIAYLDCFAGISGDMLLGSLVDAGVPREVLVEAADAMALGASLQFETVDRSGITAIKVNVLAGDRLADAPGASQVVLQQEAKIHTRQDRSQHQHRGGHQAASSSWPEEELSRQFQEQRSDSDGDHGRSLSEIREMIRGSLLSAEVKHLATCAFELLGASEAKIHNVPVDEIHFHEVGAVDAIVDIVASAAGLVHLGISSWHCSPVNVGGGTVRCAHGLFPVPAPATADLLRGVPTYSAHLQKELTTPTGAALLRAIAPTFGVQPAMAIQSIGYGAGTRNPPGFPNVLRLSVGQAAEASQDTGRPPAADTFAQTAAPLGRTESVVVLETALDDATPQLLAYVAEVASKSGAMDVTLTPVLMKKGRPGTLLTVLCAPSDAHVLQNLLLRETTTLGVRMREERRVCLDRKHVAVETEYGTVRVKIGTDMGNVLNAHPEFEDCRRLAEQTNVPLKQVFAAAVAAYQNVLISEGASE